jgi:uncharacterized oxidoreductase
MKLDGNTILITGGGSGIGLELARQLIGRGNTVLITGRDTAKLERAATAIPGLHTMPSDVRRAEDIEALHARVMKDFASLNILINNAGVVRPRNFNVEGPALDDLSVEIDVNLTGPIKLTRRFLPQLKSKPNAAVVNIGSSLAFVPLPIMPVYCATKAAIHSFSLSLRVQLQPSGVKVFELMPPTTQTDLMNVFDPGDLKGVQIMAVDDLVKEALKGIERDRYEIRPGQSNQLRFMSRLAPDFIFAQLTKSVAKMLAR